MPPISPERWRDAQPVPGRGAGDRRRRAARGLAGVARARDPALAADLAILLAEHTALARRALPRRHRPAARRRPSLAGQAIGAYRLVSPIGQGGMGSVWLAERCDGRFEGRAAVKLLNIALVGRGGEERFRAKAPSSPGSRHPHIAHLVDAGVSHDRPALSRARARRRRADRSLLRRARARHRGAAAPVPRRARRGRARARQPDRAPRHQAGERARQRRRAGQAARLRHRQAARGRRRRRRGDRRCVTRDGGGGADAASTRRPSS